ncbi:MAG: lyase family protein [Motiliproteus sp.]
MIGYVTLGSNDISRAAKFYDALLDEIGAQRFLETEQFVAWSCGPGQPGSSIMPGKVNPVIPEAVNQVAYQVIGADLAVTMAAEAGQLQLNAMEPLISYNLLNSIKMLSAAMDMLNHRCIIGVEANRAQCALHVERSIGIVTALNPYISYENATRIAKRALKEDRGVIELVQEEKLISPALLDQVLHPDSMIRPSGAEAIAKAS